MNLFRKIVLYTLTALLLIIISAVASLYLFKDRIIQQFIREANKNLETPIHIGTIDISILEDFPEITILFTDVYVEDSHPGQYPLLTAKNLSFSLNPIDAWQERYVIKSLRMSESETNLRVSKEGKTNYKIVKSSQGQGGSVSFDLNDITLNKSVVSYVDLSVAQRHTFSSERLTATLLARGDLYDITAKGDVTIGQIGVGRSKFLEEKTLHLESSILYDDEEKSLDFKPSVITLAENHYEVSGSYDFKEKNLIDIRVVAKDTDIQSLFALLPATVIEPYKKYESRGEVYFDALLKGEIGPRRSPRLKVSFGFRDVTLIHPEFKSNIEKVNLEGGFNTPSLSRFSQAELSLEKISATLNGTPFKGNFIMKNFDDPFVTLDFDGEPKAVDLLNFYPMESTTNVSGSVKAHVSLSGRIALLKNKTTAQQVSTDGTVELINLGFAFGKKKLAFSNLNGNLQFNNNDLAMSDLRGNFEKSDFLLNGFFKNIVTYAIFENQPIGIEADLTSSYLDVERLLEAGFGDSREDRYEFSISPLLHLNFNCKVDSLRFKKFRAAKVKGNLLVKGQVAVTRKLSLDAMGGSIELSGIVDAKNRKAIELITSATLDDIHIDSLFYVFGNFRQKFIQYKHLKGEVNASISMEATLSPSLRIFPETLVADASTVIKHGELNNFEPLKQLSKYLDDDGLNELRFADLKNDIHIENKTVLIPQMEIRSNVTTLQLSGTHTFDGKIDYRVIAPLRNKKKIDPDEAYGAIEESTTGKPKIYLKITGTTESYKVAYDQVAVRKKIAKDLKKEVEDLKEAFRLKGKKKKKELELEKDSYFDWENP